MAAEEGHVQAMYLLSSACDDPAERRRWLRMAAEEGHIQAMHELGLACGDPNEKRRWLEEAARNGWQAAMLELAEMRYRIMNRDAIIGTLARCWRRLLRLKAIANTALCFDQMAAIPKSLPKCEHLDIH
jgi:TPR repeat protein